MIASIKGQVSFFSDKYIVIENGGIGYKVHTSTETLTKIKSKEVFLYIHTHVREDAFDLFGFLDQEELSFFEMLINISGIGPRSALAILGIAPPDTLRKAVNSGDTSYLTKVSGIGRKTAEKIVIELRDKIKNEMNGDNLQGEIDALEALKSLGYGMTEAREALKKVSSSLDMSGKIKEALKILGNK